MDIIKRFQQLDRQYLTEAPAGNPATAIETPPEELQTADPAQMAADPNAQQVPTDQYSQTGDYQYSDPALAGAAQDPNSMLAPAQGAVQDLYTASELGRVYELNRVYFRMITLDNILKVNAYPELQKIAKMVEDAMKIFKLVVENISIFRDKLDEIIIAYYKFIERCFLVLEYHSRKLDKDKSKKDKKKK